MCFTILSTLNLFLVKFRLYLRCRGDVDGDLFDTRKGGAASDACVTRSVETAFQVPFLFIVTAFSCTNIIRKGPNAPN